MLIKRSFFVLCKRLNRQRFLILVLVILVTSCRYLWTLLPPFINNELLLNHYRRSRSLEYYLNNTAAKTEPLGPCGDQISVPLVILVSSAPDNYRQRAVIRNTWGKYFPTYFLIGMNETDPLIHFMTKTYAEFRNNDDLLIFSFVDHYQNLTLKTALGMQWTLQQCPKARFLMKIDDDVLVVPWRLQEVLRDHQNNSLIGERIRNAYVQRSPFSKWYLPRWLYPDDIIEEYLSGNAYLINMNHMQKILETAKKVPMINLEDVYFTGIVAKQTLGLTLTHHHRFRSSSLPIFNADCIYFNFATLHSVSSERMQNIWTRIKQFHELFIANKTNVFLKLFCPI